MKMIFKAKNGLKFLILDIIFAVCIDFVASMHENLHIQEAMVVKNRFGINLAVREDGVYSISSAVLPTLHGGETAIAYNSTRYSSKDDTLMVEHITKRRTDDPILGSSQEIDVTWKTNTAGVITTFRLYDKFPAVTFIQNFSLGGLLDTSVGDENKLSTVFPSFTVEEDEEDVGYLSFGGLFFMKNRMGRFNKNNTGKINTGVWAGPIALFTADGNTAVISPSSQFIVAFQVYDGAERSLNYGVSGRIKSIPKDFTMETVLYFGHGVKKTCKDWGNFLLQKYQTERATELDMTVEYLGYWTDRGAGYYDYPIEGKTYEDTMREVKEQAVKDDIPYRYYQLDAWWYYRGLGHGIKNWTPRPDILPSGMSYMQKTLDTPLALHSRYWLPDTDYAKVHGGLYDFITENNMSVPNDTNFWCDLFKNVSDAGWHMALYEQDSLKEHYLLMAVQKEDIHIGRDWLLHMGECATAHGVVIQYCKYQPMHALQSIEVPAVTQMRVSGDFLVDKNQWNIGISSILSDAIGLRPFKDNFRTTDNQGIEHTAVKLHTLAAILSTGPVGPGDLIGFSDVPSIKSTCRSDGLLLQPSKPAMAIDDFIIRSAIREDAQLVWTTHSQISGFIFGVILAIQVSVPEQFTPERLDLGMLTGRHFAYFHGSTETALFDSQHPLTLGPCDLDDVSLVFTSPSFKIGLAPCYSHLPLPWTESPLSDHGQQDTCSVMHATRHEVFQVVSSTQPGPCLQYLVNSVIQGETSHVPEEMKEEFILLGETSKYVPVSPDRIKSIILMNASLTLLLDVAADENVSLMMKTVAEGEIFDVTCSPSKSEGLVIVQVFGVGNFKCSTMKEQI